MELIVGLISLIALIVFFVMASNLGTIARQNRAQTQLLKEILSRLNQTNDWQYLVQVAELEKVKGNNTVAIEKYKEAKYWLEKKINETTEVKVNMVYNERLDGLNRIIKKLENPT